MRTPLNSGRWFAAQTPAGGDGLPGGFGGGSDNGSDGDDGRRFASRPARNERDRPHEPATPPDDADVPSIASETGEVADPDAEPTARPNPAPTERSTPDRPSAGQAPTATRGLLDYDELYPPSYGTPTSSWNAPPASNPPPQSSAAPRVDRFGWSIPEGMDEGDGSSHPRSSPISVSGAFERIQAEQPPRDRANPPANPSGSGGWPASPAPGAYSGQFPVPTGEPGARQSGGFPYPANEPPNVRQSRQYAVPREVTRSGRISTTGRTGQFVPVQPANATTNAPIVTTTGSQRVIAPPDAGTGTLLSDTPALLFLGVGLLLTAAMVVFITLRYSHLPAQIALHFGPAGSGQPDRIGEKRELWTLPILAGIVLAANAALAWGLHQYDRFAARLLALGTGLVGLVAWVVLLTLINR